MIFTATINKEMIALIGRVKCTSIHDQKIQRNASNKNYQHFRKNKKNTVREYGYSIFLYKTHFSEVLINVKRSRRSGASSNWYIVIKSYKLDRNIREILQESEFTMIVRITYDDFFTDKN